jgi:hypothetical protein
VQLNRNNDSLISKSGGQSWKECPRQPVEASTSGRRRSRTDTSLSKLFGTIATSPGPTWSRLVGLLGPGYLVAVGYMDPATWATSLAARSKFGYALLTIVIAATIIALNVKLIVDQIVGQSAGRLIYGLSTRVQPVDINRSCGRKRPL